MFVVHARIDAYDNYKLIFKHIYEDNSTTFFHGSGRYGFVFVDPADLKTAGFRSSTTLPSNSRSSNRDHQRIRCNHTQVQKTLIMRLARVDSYQQHSNYSVNPHPTSGDSQSTNPRQSILQLVAHFGQKAAHEASTTLAFSLPCFCLASVTFGSVLPSMECSTLQ